MTCYFSWFRGLGIQAGIGRGVQELPAVFPCCEVMTMVGPDHPKAFTCLAPWDPSAWPLSSQEFGIPHRSVVCQGSWISCIVCTFQGKKVESPVLWRARSGAITSAVCVCVCVCVLVTQSCPTLCNPMDCSPPGPSVHGILRARILERVAISVFQKGCLIFPISGHDRDLWYFWDSTEVREPLEWRTGELVVQGGHSLNVCTEIQ